MGTCFLKLYRFIVLQMHPLLNYQGGETEGSCKQYNLQHTKETLAKKKAAHYDNKMYCRFLFLKVTTGVIHTHCIS